MPGACREVFLSKSCAVMAGAALLVSGSVVVGVNYSRHTQAGKLLAATCTCISEPVYTDDSMIMHTGSSIVVVPSTSCNVEMRAVTLPTSAVEKYVTSDSPHCGDCPGPSTCYIDPESGEILFSEDAASKAVVAGAIMVGIGGLFCLAAGAAYAVQGMRRHRKARLEQEAALRRSRSAYYTRSPRGRQDGAYVHYSVHQSPSTSSFSFTCATYGPSPPRSPTGRAYVESEWSSAPSVYEGPHYGYGGDYDHYAGQR